MLCVSPNIEGPGRCKKLAVGTSKHCIDHSALLRPIYLQYKAVDINLWYTEEQLSNLDGEALQEILDKTKQVYDLRALHRKLGFIKELWDRGHDFVIEKCIAQIFLIQSLLEQKHVPEAPKDYVEQILQEESDWEDSEAIKAYKEKATRLEISKKIAWSYFSKVIPSESLSLSIVLECVDAFVHIILVLKETRHYIKHSRHNYNYKFKANSKCSSCEECMMAKLTLFINFLKKSFGQNVIGIFCNMLKKRNYKPPKQIYWEVIGDFKGQTLAELKMNPLSDDKIIIRYRGDSIVSAQYQS